ncbi:SDR family NAD(P)-dependent oxidoreductase [Heyndrickxia acidicola]|uniref:SDR family NAD(P)-dependent oxidoreductase n=1 Tax=Heyndrickxia acidicola TaxID=209389 RepID=A0ABU6MDW3_9BACI|nr:SDR family oxidoreductase [Heyndrickxia acidicola]MED1202221.1 SDR family NAD(P)-dependent oxidoreductase [Heyndrickxia acidicola]
MDLNLIGKHVLITGGSKGIGKAIAEAFVAEGASVSIAARDRGILKKAKDELGGNISIYQADVSNAGEREKLIQSFINDKGKIDILINNAGGSNGGSAEETKMALFYEAMELNYYSAVHLSKMAFEQMKDQKQGAIINITSIFGRESGGKVTYNNAKAALISFTKALADEAIGFGVRVNSIAPGSILHETGNWKKRIEANPQEMKEFIKREIPAGRFGTPEEIANTAVFLASEKASWIVGASINVDGGQSRMNF